MRRLPGALFVVDPQRESIAVAEARRLEIPIWRSPTRTVTRT